MWFGLYSRNNNKMDSSGFEHIFAGLDRGDMFETPQMFCKYVFLTFLTFCNRRSQGRKGVWFPQLDPVLSSWEKRTAELLQPQLQRARKRQQLRPQRVGFCCYMCSSAFSFFLSFSLLSVDYLPWCHGDAVHVGWLLQAGRVFSHWLQPWIRLCPLQPLLHQSPWKTVSNIYMSCLVFLCVWAFSDCCCLCVPHPQVSSEPGRKGSDYPNLHLGKNVLRWWEEVYRLCFSCNSQELKLPSTRWLMEKSSSVSLHMI